MNNTLSPITAIPFRKLTPWKGNVRKTNPSAAIEALAASIEAHGLLQSLSVRPSSKGKYAVIAGRRRYLALSYLIEKGVMDEDAEIPCLIKQPAADDSEVSLAENTLREPMHPADQYAAFRSLVEGGATVAGIAARFGVSEGTVKKRLALGRVSPALLDAYRRDELTLEQLAAFTVTDDLKQQLRAWKDLPSWNCGPSAIRRALTQETIAAADSRARLVTVEAYEAAGGAVRRDLFSEGESGVYLLDNALLDRLAAAKLDEAAKEVSAEGWKWVEIRPQFGYDDLAVFHQARPEPVALTQEESAELDGLMQRCDEMENGEPSEEETEEADAMHSRIAALQEKAEFNPETLAIAGAVVSISHDGIHVTRGLVRQEDMPGQEAHPKKRTESSAEFTASLTERLSAEYSAALSAELMDRPETALAAVVYALALRTFQIYGGESSVQIHAAYPNLGCADQSKAGEALNEARIAWNERLPGEPAALWEWCIGQQQYVLLELLAFCAACTVNAV